ncbi:DUF982 domain-containing protein [Aminobacter ciceronei]|jgi:hypothetical protein|uniref:DUF982 domain-containing protein n=1 Tax=Aminobacter ciceronei TaxID=150723 RepID=UPI003F702647
MRAQAFGRAVFVRDGAHIREIQDINDALAFMGAWPTSRRGPIYDSALRACHAAQVGQLHADGASDAIRAFARSVGILEQTPVAIDPWVIAAQVLRGAPI